MTSFVALRQPKFEPGQISVMWHEHRTQDTYVVDLGHDVSMHLLPADARELVAKLTAAMAERGDVVDYKAVAAEAVSQLEALAHDASWGRLDSIERLRSALGRIGHAEDARAAGAAAEARQWATIVGSRDEPAVDGPEDHATDRERDRLVGL